MKKNTRELILEDTYGFIKYAYVTRYLHHYIRHWLRMFGMLNIDDDFYAKVPFIFSYLYYIIHIMSRSYIYIFE